MSGDDMKGMAELLRSGATMLGRSCPECGSPLFRVKSGDIVCANCQRRVVIVPEGEEAAVEAGVQLESLEKALVEKLVTVGDRLSQESDTGELMALSGLLDSLLVVLERLRKVRKV
ncbi:MAG: Sjogren's syndrome/scleroderma autoantigen 1 family protein [Candidatus Bathyarchaeota archaeon]